MRIVEREGGEVVVLTLGPPEAEEQLRDAMAIGADRAILLETDEPAWDAQATAAAIVEAIAADGTVFDLIVFGNESADNGNYQVGIRVAYALGRPVATGLKGLSVEDGRLRCEQDAGGRRDVYVVPLPAVVTVKEGLNLPRYPSVPGRLRAKSKPLARRRADPARAAAREGAPGAAGRPGPAGRGARPRRRRGAEGRRGHALARGRMTILVLVEHDGAEPDELSLQALALRPPARRAGRGGAGGRRGRGGSARRSTSRTWPSFTVATRRAPGRPRSPGSPGGLGAGAVVAAGSDRGNEVLAHVAARLDLPFAANCIDVLGDGPVRVLRQRWGGSLLEEARVHGAPALLSVAPHAVAADEAPGDGRASSSSRRSWSPRTWSCASARRSTTAGGGVSLAEAKVVVSGGRGVGSAEGFAIIEELAGLLGGAVGCSRVVTSAGWRPHADQVGQTGTKVSPDLYIACGISGATQHIAGCKGAKKMLAINDDPEAPILASADYAVIGDLHEIVPAISAELRKARGA